MFSKTNYTDGLQCPKMLWMQANMPEKRDEECVRQDLLRAGDEVGALARQWAGPHVLIDNDYDYARMAAETAAALSRGETVCEATFMNAGCVCLCDICIPKSDGALALLEVKASTKLKPYHLDDAAFQAWVLRGAGHRVSSASIVHIDPEYRLHGVLDLEKLFKVEDVTEEVDDRLAAISPKLDDLKAVLALRDEPECEIGRHCNSPHPCPFQGWCWRDVPEDSVFTVAGIGNLRGMSHWQKGRRTFADVLEAGDAGLLKLNGFQRAQLSKTERFDARRVEDFLDNLSYPLYFLDFETVQPAIPMYEGTKPYQQIPTQFSLHWLNSPDSKLHHAEYLAPSVGDPREGVADALVEAIPQGACVLAYNMSFEKGRIRELAEAFPGSGFRLMAIHDAVCDLMIPFQKGFVYLPAMHGSYSIKKVLPAVCPGDPELDYHALSGVHNGSEAMDAFAGLAALAVEDPGREAEVREQLLRYCELDTLAMVKIWEWLRNQLTSATQR